MYNIEHKNYIFNWSYNTYFHIAFLYATKPSKSLYQDIDILLKNWSLEKNLIGPTNPITNLTYP